MNRQVVLFGAVATLALLVAMFAVIGTAVADTCVDESCNSGNVAEVEVESGGLGMFLNLGVIAGDSNLTVNDAFNTDVSVIQTQEGGPAAPVEIPEDADCVDGSCNTGNVTEVEVDNGVEISIGDLFAIDGVFEAEQLDGLLEIELPCTIVAVNIGVIEADSGIDVNVICNSSVDVAQSQG